MPPILELRGITTRFPGVLANDHIDLSLEEGEIHALLGENGAGKTTLMNILYGLYQPDEGEIHVHGRRGETPPRSDAIAGGIGMVHQHFMLIPVFTVAENVMLGQEIARRGGFLDRREAEKRVGEISSRFQLALEPTAVLTPQESDELFKIMRSLASQGKSIIFITHKLREVMDVADRITVIRQGRLVGTTTPKQADRAKLALMMVGRQVLLEIEKPEKT